MGDFNLGHIQWTPLESAGGDQWWECVIMGDFNHDHIQWTPLESAGGDQWWECVGFHFVFSKLIS